MTERWNWIVREARCGGDEFARDRCADQAAPCGIQLTECWDRLVRPARRSDDRSAGSGLTYQTARIGVGMNEGSNRLVRHHRRAPIVDRNWLARNLFGSAGECGTPW